MLNEAVRERVGLVQQRQRTKEMREGRKTACDVPKGTSHAKGEKNRESEAEW
ncbi:hypothetical protein [Burkholderia ubonensis]|uniref:hypothetical protein n=1 Tax=Burkholderia ubonensis TaxID=101571 RepID=UPI001E47AF5C|nr:hypothetical protein [Burkholderia ubonensis]